MSSLIQSIHDYTFVQRLIPSPQASENQGQVVAYSIGTPPVPKESVQGNTQRKAWSFLTTTIPAMIEAFSLFCQGIIFREKVGIPLRVRFPRPSIPEENHPQITKFHNYDHRTPGALSWAEKTKIQQITNRILNTHESNPTEAKEKLRPYLALLEKCKSAKVTRNQFQEDDWKTLDHIDYELAQDYFDNLVDVFNSRWMNGSGLQNYMNKDFGFDYYEAVLAENLSLSLAYVEGLNGKQISLPVLDTKTGRYRLVVYDIKETRLGDALPCYTLESKDPDAHPWFLVRGTQPYTGLNPKGKELRVGSLESILADSLDHECISRNVINKSLVHRPVVNIDGKLVQEESLSDIFRNWRSQGKQVNLCGHSLGGTLVNALTVEFYDQVRSAYAFSGAGVSDEMATRWELLKELDPTDSYRTKLKNFDYEGDFIPSGGRRLIGEHFAMASVDPDQKIGLYHSHVYSRLNCEFQIQKIDTEKENGKLSRRFMERVRVIVGKCFRLLLMCVNSKYVPDWWKRSKDYIVYAAFERHVRHVVHTNNKSPLVSC